MSEERSKARWSAVADGSKAAGRDARSDPDLKEPSGKDGRGDRDGKKDVASKGARDDKDGGDARDPKAVVCANDEERWRRTKSNMKTIGGAVLLALFIRILLFEAFAIDGPSMEPTLLNGDRVVVARFPYGLFLPYTNEALLTWGTPAPGDVVIVKSPLDNIDIVKRVIGVSGDTIEIRNDVVWRNGAPIHRRVLGPCREEESSADPIGCEWVEEGIGELRWRTSHSLHSVPESMGPVLVPEGHIFVLGDHRDRSNDSRNPRVGMIPVARVKGLALAIYWSREGRVRWDRMFSAIH